MVKKDQINEEILTLLEKSTFGLSVNKIAERLGYSRTTITKYLKELEEKDLAFNQDIGQYKVWHHKLEYSKRLSKWESVSSFFEPFYQSLTKVLPQMGISFDQFKEMGIKIAQNIDYSDLMDNILDPQNLKMQTADTFDLEFISKLIMQVIDALSSKIDSYKWNTPIIFEAEKRIILRMEKSVYINNPAHFYLFAGMIEAEMNKFIPVTITIHQIQQEQNVIDFLFQL
jgi:biotin operon repressor